jgi:hypothetical protein
LLGVGVKINKTCFWSGFVGSVAFRGLRIPANLIRLLAQAYPACVILAKHQLVHILFSKKNLCIVCFSEGAVCFRKNMTEMLSMWTSPVENSKHASFAPRF